MGIPEYNVNLRVRNNWLLKKMAIAGFHSVRELAEAAGLSQPATSNYLNFKVAPYTQKGVLRDGAYRLCVVLKATPEELWPPKHQQTPMPKNSRTVELSAADLQLLLEGPASDTAEQLLIASDESFAIDDALSTLTPREERIVRMRYGLGGCNEHTLEETAAAFGVTRERIRQIELRALRKLRHPSRAKAIVDSSEWLANALSRRADSDHLKRHLRRYQ